MQSKQVILEPIVDGEKAITATNSVATATSNDEGKEENKNE